MSNEPIYSVTADTAEEMRDAIVRFLEHRSTAHRGHANLTTGKHAAAYNEARASALSDAALFLRNVTINHRTPEESAS